MTVNVTEGHLKYSISDMPHLISGLY